MKAFVKEYLITAHTATEAIIEAIENERQSEEKAIVELQQAEDCVQLALSIKSEVESLEQGNIVPNNTRAPAVPRYMTLEAPFEKFNDILFSCRLDHQVKIEGTFAKVPICVSEGNLLILYCYQRSLVLCSSSDGATIKEVIEFHSVRIISELNILEVKKDSILLHYGAFAGVLISGLTTTPSTQVLLLGEMKDECYFLKPRASLDQFTVGYFEQDLVVYSKKTDQSHRFFIPDYWRDSRGRPEIHPLLDLDADRLVIVAKHSTAGINFVEQDEIRKRVEELSYLLAKRESLLSKADERLALIHSQYNQKRADAERHLKEIKEMALRPEPAFLPLVYHTFSVREGTPFWINETRAFYFHTRNPDGVTLVCVYVSGARRSQLIKVQRASARPFHVEQITESSFLLASSFVRFHLNYEFQIVCERSNIIAPSIKPPNLQLGFQLPYFTLVNDNGIEVHLFVEHRYGPWISTLCVDGRTFIWLGSNKWFRLP